MLSLVVAAILVSAASAATRCCIDRQYEAVFGEIGGAVYSQNGKPSPTMINGQNVIHFDYYSRKMAMENTLMFSNGTNVTYEILVDYSTDLMYVQNAGNCFQLPNVAPNSYVDGCVPDNAQLIRSSYIGYGANQIPFTTWQFLEPKSGNVVRMSLTDVGCIPIVETLFGNINNGDGDLIFIVTGFRPGIRKPALLNIPKPCIPVPQNDLPYDAQRAIKRLELLTKFR